MKTYSVEVLDETCCIHRAGPIEGSTSAGVWLFRYPNLAINVYADGMNIERIVPLSSTRTAVVYDYFAHDVSEEKMASMVEMSKVTLDEDQAIAELVQRNLDAGVYEAGPLSPRHENALAWFQGRIRQSTGAR
jgi:choline monooxygenase